MRLLKATGQILSFCLTALLALILVFNLLSIGSRYLTGNTYAKVLGFSTAVVVSGSMEPAISVNDMVVIQEKDNYAEKDVISYVSQSGNLITHRIVDVTDEGFVTRGDANKAIDVEAPVSVDKVVGKVVYVIPQVGLFLEYLKTPLGMLCVTLVGFVLIGLPSVLDRSRKEDEKGGKYTHE